MTQRTPLNTFQINSACNNDVYKWSHIGLYPEQTEFVQLVWMPRATSKGDQTPCVTNVGLQYYVKKHLLIDWSNNFFSKHKHDVIGWLCTQYKHIMGTDMDPSKFEELHDLGYLPIKVRTPKEGSLIPVGCPMAIIENTLPQFSWLPGFLETVFINANWKTHTTATKAMMMRALLEEYASLTCDNNSHVPYQCHDFSYRGNAGEEAALTTGLAHLCSFKGSDTAPALDLALFYYGGNVDMVSINALEHSVVSSRCPSAATHSEKEKELLKWLMEDKFANSMFAYVADTFNLWEVIRILGEDLNHVVKERHYPIVVRPDSGDPVHILTGYTEYELENHFAKYYFVPNRDGCSDVYQLAINIAKAPTAPRLFKIIESSNGSNKKPLYFRRRGKDQVVQMGDLELKGVVESLYDYFGGTVSSKGYKVLTEQIGCIYGDSIDFDVCKEICRRLKEKGFASSNFVVGLGSACYSYGVNRDTFNFATKATQMVVGGEFVNVKKDPITDSGMKTSTSGHITLIANKEGAIIGYMDADGEHILKRDESETKDKIVSEDIMQPIFLNGEVVNETSFPQVKETLDRHRILWDSQIKPILK